MSLSRVCHVACVLLLFGCTSKPPKPAVAERVESRPQAGGLLTFTSDQIGTVATKDNRVEVTWGRAFKIEGEVEGTCAVGDSIYIDLLIRVDQNKWSNAANKIAKVESVHSGKARFQADFFVTEMKDQDCRLTISCNSVTKKERNVLTEIEVRLRAPH